MKKNHNQETDTGRRITDDNKPSTAEWVSSPIVTSRPDILARIKELKEYLTDMNNPVNHMQYYELRGMSEMLTAIEQKIIELYKEYLETQSGADVYRNNTSLFFSKIKKELSQMREELEK